MSDPIKDIPDLIKYIKQYANDNPDSKGVCDIFLNRMDNLSNMKNGEVVSVESTNTYKHYITVSLAVGVPDKMNIGEILKELKRIEDMINANSGLVFEIKIS